MSDYRAIAGVSSTLKRLLEDRMAENVPATIAPPDVDVPGVPGRRLNLYLYQVTENGALKNQEIPGHGHPGAYGHPPLSLDLHYLITAHGESQDSPDADLQAQQILGDAMGVLHEFATITPQLRADNDPGGPRILDPSLVGQFEQMKIVLQPLTLDDLSKLWTALSQANFRRSVAYQVSVVQIERRRLRRFPRPVGEPPSAGARVYAVPFRRPQIHEIRVIRQNDPLLKEKAYACARIGDVLILKGSNLTGQTVRVALGGLETPIKPKADDRIEVTIPDEILPDGTIIPGKRRLQPGPQSAGVIQGVAGLPRTGVHSNQVVFMLVPYLETSGLTLQLTTVPRTLKIPGKRLFNKTFTGETLIGDALVPKDDYRNPKPTEITVPLPDTLPAWPVRCLVSGDLSSFPSLPAAPEVQVTIGSDGPRTAAFDAQPQTLAEAGRLLQSAIRSAPGGGPPFGGTRVADMNGSRLVIVPGGLGDVVTIAPSGTDATTAGSLKLTAGASASIQAYLSGLLKPFPMLTASQPALQVTIGSASPQTITLPTRPTTLAEASSMLNKALGAIFPGTRVTTLENQLLILPGVPGGIVFENIAGLDDTTVVQLQLRARYPVRVRVAGAESVDEAELELPS